MFSRRVVTRRDARERPAVPAAEVAAARGDGGAAGGPPPPPGGGPPPPVPDDYWNRLQKLIPAEAVGAFLAIDGIIRGTAVVNTTAYWIIYGFMVLICLGYAARVYRGSGLPVSWPQVGVAVGAFLIWTYTIGGPFEYAGFLHDRAIGGIVVILYTTAVPLLIR